MPQASGEYEFVELNRTFHELSENAGDGEDSYIRRAWRREKPLRWADLVQEFRVVVLSEAGTGKTEEIRNLTKTLRGKDKAAFFLRLEHIPNDFEDAFEVGSFQNSNPGLPLAAKAGCCSIRSMRHGFEIQATSITPSASSETVSRLRSSGLIFLFQAGED